MKSHLRDRPWGLCTCAWLYTQLCASARLLVRRRLSAKPQSAIASMKVPSFCMHHSCVFQHAGDCALCTTLRLPLARCLISKGLSYLGGVNGFIKWLWQSRWSRWCAQRLACADACILACGLIAMQVMPMGHDSHKAAKPIEFWACRCPSLTLVIRGPKFLQWAKALGRPHPATRHVCMQTPRDLHWSSVLPESLHR